MVTLNYSPNVMVIDGDEQGEDEEEEEEEEEEGSRSSGHNEGEGAEEHIQEGVRRDDVGERPCWVGNGSATLHEEV